MEVKIKRTDSKFRFEGYNGNSLLSISASPQLSGTSSGFRPMQLLLTSLGSCMSIDVLNILYKQQQSIDHFEVKVSGERTAGVPSVFESMLLEFHLRGNIEEQKVQRAIQLSCNSYCSVYKMLSPTIDITTKYYLNGR